ncbi:MAG: M56 family metallopeptidase [Lachnospiraceae bacterium]|jgi:beta-lactamase regulating signal transducer with metallopeptidase domain|nr:M56 family metallopeptidase [Lachnospiraceae bacterium]
MINWIITSSMLIVVILAVRKFFGDRLTPGARYGLWFLVLLRLLIPVSFFQSSYSVAELTEQAGTILRQRFSQEPEQYVLTDTEYMTDGPAIVGSDEKIYPESYGETEEHIYVPAESPLNLFSGEGAVFYVIWLTGMGGVGVFFLMINLFLRVRIYGDREEIDEEELEKRGLRSEVSVYVTGFVETPCIAGLRGAAVYLPVSLWEELSQEGEDQEKREKELGAVICHENIHYRHGDQLWSLLRLFCLVLHWYNPLVWAAALISKQDGELFCDAAVVREIGEKNRFEYGRLLLRITAQEEQNAGRLSGIVGYAGLCNTEMADTKKHMEQRINMLAKRPKKNTAAVWFVLLAALAVWAWLFTGGRDVAEREVDEKFVPEGGDARSDLSGEAAAGALFTDGTSAGYDMADENAEGRLIFGDEAAEGVFFPGREETEEVRKRALQGMSEEEIDALTVYVKDYHNWLEYKLLYENWESRLLDKENAVWNFIDESGTVLAGWRLEDDPADYLELGEEGREELMRKYPEFGQISLEELRKKYGEPYYEENRYGAEMVTERIRELTASAENEVFQTDVEELCGALQQAKDTHKVVYVTQAHEILHDMEYFLLRYSPRDVSPYTTDKTLSGRYYGALEVWKAWQEGRL